MNITKKKRPVALIMCMAMVMSVFGAFVVAPIEAAAATATTALWINDGTSDINVLTADEATLQALGITYTAGTSETPGTLKLSDVNLTTSYSSGGNKPVTAGIYAVGDLIIELTDGTTNVVNYGIYVNGALEITGSGSLTAGYNGDSSENNASTRGIYTSEGFTMNGTGTVTANGANASNGSSSGIYSSSTITINSGNVSATGGGGNGSYGIFSDGKILIKDGNVTAKGGKAQYHTTSSGIRAGSEINITGGTISATGGESSGDSFGIFSGSFGITINNAVVTAIGGNAPNSYGIFAGTVGDFVVSITITDATVTAKSTHSDGQAFSKTPIFTVSATNGADVTYDIGGGDVNLYALTEGQVNALFASAGDLSPISGVKEFKIVEPAEVRITLDADSIAAGAKLYVGDTADADGMVLANESDISVGFPDGIVPTKDSEGNSIMFRGWTVTESGVEVSYPALLSSDLTITNPTKSVTISAGFSTLSDANKTSTENNELTLYSSSTDVLYSIFMTQGGYRYSYNPTPFTHDDMLAELKSIPALYSLIGNYRVLLNEFISYGSRDLAPEGQIELGQTKEFLPSESVNFMQFRNLGLSPGQGVYLIHVKGTETITSYTPGDPFFGSDQYDDISINFVNGYADGSNYFDVYRLYADEQGNLPVYFRDDALCPVLIFIEDSYTPVPAPVPAPVPTPSYSLKLQNLGTGATLGGSVTSGTSTELNASVISGATLGIDPGTKTNYIFSHWEVVEPTSGADLANIISEDETTLTMPAHDLTLKAVWESEEDPTIESIVNVEVTHKITATAGVGGSISPEGVSTYGDGSTSSYFFTPDSGMYVDKLFIDGREYIMGEDNFFTFTNISADHTIHVTFTSEEPTDPSDPSSPETGDGANLTLWATIALVVVAGVAVFLRKRLAK